MSTLSVSQITDISLITGGAIDALSNQVNVASTISNNTFGQANTARNQANTAYNQANTAYNQANTAFNQANTKLANTTTTLSGTLTITQNLTIGTATAETPTGNTPLAFCRAWVNFNGTGTVAIRSSFNVSSITDHGTGDYSVNFTTAFADSNYAATIGFEQADAIGSTMAAGIKTMSTSAVRIKCERSNGADEDLNFVCLSAFA